MDSRCISHIIDEDVVAPEPMVEQVQLLQRILQLQLLLLQLLCGGGGRDRLQRRRRGRRRVGGEVEVCRQGRRRRIEMRLRLEGS